MHMFAKCIVHGLSGSCTPCHVQGVSWVVTFRKLILKGKLLEILANADPRSPPIDLTRSYGP